MRDRDNHTYKKHCKVRNKVKKAVRSRRRLWETDTAMDVKKTPKKAWRYIKSKYKIKKSIHHLKVHPDEANSILTKTDKEKAKVLQQFFSSVFTIEPDDELSPVRDERVAHQMEEECVVSKEDILAAIKEMNPTKIEYTLFY